MFRQPTPDDGIHPDHPMIGKCLACGTVVRAVRSACEHRIDPGFGQVLCVGCPKEIGRDPMSGDPLHCDNRVRMIREENWRG